MREELVSLGYLPEICSTDLVPDEDRGWYSNDLTTQVHLGTSDIPDVLWWRHDGRTYEKGHKAKTICLNIFNISLLRSTYLIMFMRLSPLWRLDWLPPATSMILSYALGMHTSRQTKIIRKKNTLFTKFSSPSNHALMNLKLPAVLPYLGHSN